MSLPFSSLFLADQVLRRWSFDRLRKRWPVADDLIAHRPPYLPEPPAAEQGQGDGGWREQTVCQKIQGSLLLQLPGQTIEVAAEETRHLFTRSFDDDETVRGLQSFVWLPLQPDTDPCWVTALWQGWAAHHGLPDADSPAWEPSVAARRALNMLDYATASGLPAPRAENVARLAAHAPIIAAGLDWRVDGSHDTRLIAEGAALARLGMALGLEAHAQAGFTVLTEEAKRQFGSSGLLSQGSTHHHLVAVQDCLGVWLAARRRNRPEAAMMEELVHRILAPVSALCIDGQLPMVGDLSAEFPPSFSAGLLPDGPLNQGWTALLTADDRVAFAQLRDSCRQPDLEALRGDGWLRQTVGVWSGLWHGFPSGWSPVKGYGHADLGSATLHYKGVPIFIDPGNGVSGAEGRAYRSAAAHGGLTLNGADPYPRNRGFYSDGFRRDIAGKPPVLQAEFDGASCQFEGYSYLLGHNEVRQHWSIEGETLRIADIINGTGRVVVARRLITALPVTLEDGAAILSAPGFRLKVSGNGPAVLQPGKVWTAWGVSEPATAITFSVRTNLPWQGQITVEPIA